MKLLYFSCSSNVCINCTHECLWLSQEVRKANAATSKRLGDIDCQECTPYKHNYHEQDDISCVAMVQGSVLNNMMDMPASELQYESISNEIRAIFDQLSLQQKHNND